MKTIQCHLKQVTASWKQSDRPLIQRVDLEIDSTKRCIVPLVGPTGRGKSTLLYLMAGLMLPQKGEVQWSLPAQRDQANQSDQETEYSWGVPQGSKQAKRIRELHRDRFGFVFQDSTVFSHLTVLENLIYPSFLKKDSWEEAEKKARKRFAQVLTPSEDLEDLLAQFPRELSGGQRQRVAIVQAMLNSPNVLFADEPTGHLDEESRKRVLKVLYDWVTEGEVGEKMLLWITHHCKEEAIELNQIAQEANPGNKQKFLQEYLLFEPEHPPKWRML